MGPWVGFAPQQWLHPTGQLGSLFCVLLGVTVCVAVADLSARFQYMLALVSLFLPLAWLVSPFYGKTRHGVQLASRAENISPV